MATCRPQYIFEAKQRCLASQSGLPGQRQGCSPWKSFVLSTALGLNYDTLVTLCARSLCRKKVHSENWSLHRPCIDLFPMQPSCVSPPPYCHCTMTGRSLWRGMCVRVFVHYTRSIQEALDLSKRKSHK